MAPALDKELARPIFGDAQLNYMFQGRHAVVHIQPSTLPEERSGGNVTESRAACIVRQRDRVWKGWGVSGEEIVVRLDLHPSRTIPVVPALNAVVVVAWGPPWGTRIHGATFSFKVD
jgi:hypothetical protein